MDDRGTFSSVQIKVEEEIRPHVKRNVITSISDGTIDAIATGMIPLQTVIVYFISGYIKSNFLIGLLSTVQLLFMAVPQIFMARYLDRQGYFKKLMGIFVLVSRTQSLIIGLLIFFVAPCNKILFIILFYAVYWLNGFVLGASSITYSVFINKVVPFKVRARFFGVRGMFCSMGSIIGSVLCGFILAAGDTQSKYAYLFLVAFLIDMISFAFIIAAFEPKTIPNGNSGSRDFKNKITRILRYDKNLINYVAAFSLVMFALSVFSFQTLYAKSSLNLTTDKLSLMTSVIFVFQTVGYIIWGFIATKYGFKSCMIAGYSIFAVNLVIAPFIANVQLLLLLSAIYGLAFSTQMIGGTNFIYNICSYENRPAYVSISNSVVIPVTAMAPLINGLLFDALGFKIMCILNLAVLCTGLFLMYKIKETVCINDKPVQEKQVDVIT